VELRLGEKRSRLPQNLVGALEVTILALKVLQPLPFFSAQSGALAGIALGLAHPPPQTLRRAAQLRRQRLDRCLLRRILATVLLDHAHGALTDFGGKPTGASHRVHPLSEWALRQSRYGSSQFGAGQVRPSHTQESLKGNKSAQPTSLLVCLVDIER